MISRLLIANRGEIALRIIRACNELDIESVVVYSQADAGAPYLKLTDEAICIGPGPSALSYLSIPTIISAAEIANVDAVHPGYGFLSENPDFAHRCAESGTSASIASPRASTLLPSRRMTSGGGPMNVIPDWAQRWAKSGFSDRKP